MPALRAGTARSGARTLAVQPGESSSEAPLSPRAGAPEAT